MALEIVPDDDDPRLALPFVAMRIDGRPVRALLDSGAARSVVVEWPGLQTLDAQTDGTGVFGDATAERRAQVTASIGGIEFGTTEVSVVPVDHPGTGHLLGQDILSRFRCEYRLAEGVLLLDGSLPDEVHQVYLDATSHVYVDVAWRTGEVASAVLDTGASVTVVDADFAARNPSLFAQSGQVNPGVDASGAVQETSLVRMAAIQILGAELEESVAAVVDLRAVNATVQRNMDLILGWPILSQGVFVVDHHLRVAS